MMNILSPGARPEVGRLQLLAMIAIVTATSGLVLMQCIILFAIAVALATTIIVVLGGTMAVMLIAGGLSNFERSTIDSPASSSGDQIGSLPGAPKSTAAVELVVQPTNSSSCSLVAPLRS